MQTTNTMNTSGSTYAATSGTTTGISSGGVSSGGGLSSTGGVISAGSVETKSGIGEEKMFPTTTKQIWLNKSPSGLPKDSTFKLQEVPIPQLKAGEFLVRNHFLSIDPYIRAGCMTDSEIGKPLHCSSVGEVIATTVPDKWPVGTFMSFYFARTSDRGLIDGFGATEYGIGSITDERFYRKIDPNIAPISTSLGILGMPGMTAYFGVRNYFLCPKGGTAVVTGAAGAVGSLVGQLLKRAGVGKVIGIAGNNDKCTKLRSLFGYDFAINYKSQNVEEELRKICPEGIDAFWDNVGGDLKVHIMKFMKPNACLLACGGIAEYNKSSHGPSSAETKLLQEKQIMVKSFMVADTCDQWQSAIAELAPLVKSGELKYEETFIDGIEDTGKALISLLSGGNTGKMLVRLPAARTIP